jgi:hypothetical protein
VCSSDLYEEFFHRKFLPFKFCELYTHIICVQRTDVNRFWQEGATAGEAAAARLSGCGPQLRAASASSHKVEEIFNFLKLV